MKIGLIGAGRLGICLALLIEQAGYEVLVSDIRTSYVDDLNKKEIITEEPDVEWLLKQTKRFEATWDNQRVIDECDFIICLVATPSLSNGSYDISSVWNVVEDFKKSEVKLNGKTLVIGCTTNPGDCEKFSAELDYYGVGVVYNPEFIAQGSIVKDLRNADMVLIGGADDDTFAFMEALYRKIQVQPPKYGRMSTSAAEIVKLAVNCYLTTKISYANMVGEVMCMAGMENEINTVLNAIGDDSRIGNKYLKFGYGFGGPCLPRDNRAFASFAQKLGLKYNLGETTDNFNKEHAKFLCNYYISKNKDSSPFYFRYVSYKEGTDILTESQQYRLCEDLLYQGYTCYVDDNESIINQLKQNPTLNIARLKYGRPEENEQVIEINL
jgi:UDPglucose 6-dehydrogenase